MSFKGIKLGTLLAVGLGIGAGYGGIGSAHATFISTGPTAGNPKTFLFLNMATDTTTFSANAGKHGLVGDFIWNAVADVDVDVANGYSTIKPSAKGGVIDFDHFHPRRSLDLG